MTKNRSQKKSSDKDKQKLHKTLMEDLRRGGLKRTLRQDFRDIYDFYIDSESRKRLKSMGRVRRWIRVAYWILRSLILKLSPLRRLLLVLSLIFYLFYTNIQSEQAQVNINLRLLGFVILLIVLMLELKDKLLAQDELAAGRAVQSALMPKDNPKISGWDIWLYTQSANEVGGDLVDYIRISKNRLGLALGDVAGKGLGAALVTAKLQATLRALAPNFPSLVKLGEELNRIFCRDRLPERFVSLVYLDLVPDSGRVRFLNAGHLPPVVIQSGKLQESPRGGPALSILPKATYKEQHIELQPGDLLFVYSDGITEAQNEQGEFFDEPRLFDLLRNHRTLSAEKIGIFILTQVKDFIGEKRPTDDLSMIVLKYTPRQN